MKLSRKLLERHFPDAEITWCFGTWYIKTKAGSELTVTQEEFSAFKGGADIPPKFADISRRYLRLLLGCNFMELQATPHGKWPVTCIADEFPLLGRAQIFQTVFAEGRGHGIRVVAICQNAGQMISAYGEQGFRNFLSCSGLQLFFPPKDLETATEISRLAGRKTLITLNHSSGRRVDQWGGFSVSETGADVLTPHEIMGMDNTQLIAVAPGLVPNIMVLRRRNYWDYPDIAKLCDPNPYAPAGAGNAERERFADRIEQWRRRSQRR